MLPGSAHWPLRWQCTLLSALRPEPPRSRTRAKELQPGIMSQTSRQRAMLGAEMTPRCGPSTGKRYARRCHFGAMPQVAVKLVEPPVDSLLGMDNVGTTWLGEAAFSKAARTSGTHAE